MIRQGIVNDGILEKKFKILRTSIMLGNVRNREEVMSSYETTAREALRLASHKLPIKCKFIKKEESGDNNEN